MRGYLLLSEGRSGSNWLGSLASKTQKMGKLREWLGDENHEKVISSYTEDEFFETVMSKAQSANGRFAIKLFPRHLHNVQINLGFDFIKRCISSYPTRLVLLKRQDTFAQAVSLVRGIQTRQWHSKNEAKAEPVYDFSLLCRAYFFIRSSYNFWESYLAMNEYEHDSFTYEGLLKDQAPYLDNLLEHLQLEHNEGFATDLKIQRDELSAEWLERFREDIKNNGIVEYCEPIGAFESYCKPQQSTKKRHGLAGIFGR